MFDTTRPHVIILTDHVENLTTIRGIGVYKVAAQLRKAGIGALVLDNLHLFSVEEIKTILNRVVNSNTVFIGVNNFWYRNLAEAKVEPPHGSLHIPPWEYGHKDMILPHGQKFNREIIDLVKAKNPQTKFVLGGPAALDLEHNKVFDYLVVGFAEMSVVRLAQHLLHGYSLPGSKRSVWGPTIVRDDKADGYDFTNDDFAFHEQDCIIPEESLPLEVARGCIFSCKFCAYPLNGKKKLDYVKSFDLLHKHLIDNYQRFGTTKYHFIDDTFNDSVEKCQLIYDISQSLPFKLEYAAYIRLDLVAAHPETIPLLFESGLVAPFYGVESLNAKTAAAIGKGGSRQKLIDTAVVIRDRYKPRVCQTASFIFGLPYETMESMQETADWLCSENCPFDVVNMWPLQLFDAKSQTWLSEIEKNYEKYGYEITGRIAGTTDRLEWKNATTSWQQVWDLYQDVQQRVFAKQNPIGWGKIMSFYSMGIDFESISSPSASNLDWDRIDTIKLQRCKTYRALLTKQIGLDLSFNSTACNFTQFFIEINNLDSSPTTAHPGSHAHEGAYHTSLCDVEQSQEISQGSYSAV